MVKRHDPIHKHFAQEPHLVSTTPYRERPSAAWPYGGQPWGKRLFGTAPMSRPCGGTGETLGRYET